MRERLPSSFRLGNKGLSGQLALLCEAQGGDMAGTTEWPEQGCSASRQPPAQLRCQEKSRVSTQLAGGMPSSFHGSIS